MQPSARSSIAALIAITLVATTLAAPQAPLQLGVTFAAGSIVNGNNTVSIELANGSIITLLRASNNSVGLVQPLLIGTARHPRLHAGERLLVFLNGFNVANTSFAPGGTHKITAPVRIPLCGDGPCASQESCILCRTDCICNGVNIVAIPRNEQFVKKPLNDTLTVLFNNTGLPFFDIVTEGVPVARIFRDPLNATLDLGIAQAQRGTRNGKNFIIVNAEIAKTVILSKSANRTQVCTKDQSINNITEISSACNGANERIITCNGNMNAGINCTDFGDFYTISGLAHSAVIEFETTQAPVSEKGRRGRRRTNVSDEEDFQGRALFRRPLNISGLAGFKVQEGCTSSWSCTTFAPSPCPASGFQTRICTDNNNCGTISGKPSERRACKPSRIEPTAEPPIPAQPTPVSQPEAPIPPLIEPTIPVEEIPPMFQEPTPPLEQPAALETTQNLIVLLSLGALGLLLVIVVSLFIRSKHVQAHQRFVDDAMSFIKHNRDIGYQDPQIRQMLKDAEWPENYIKDAFK
ncbi:hypothetical protein HY641_01425, partial [Candidatus Woesearchaeota archaeon]|nr:hypothetical protein [Candidatus Woesearchaeota archaeon]